MDSEAIFQHENIDHIYFLVNIEKFHLKSTITTILQGIPIYYYTFHLICK